MSAYGRAKARYLQEMSRLYPEHLMPVPRSEWPTNTGLDAGELPTEVWRSRSFLVMVYAEVDHCRLSVLRTEFAAGGDHRFRDGISWDDLQRLKRECGRGETWAVEVFPPDDEVVNVQNMRHLFVLPEPPPYGWKGKAP